MGALDKFLPLMFVTAIAGCGGSGLELGDVTGVVQLDGQPLPNAVVTFSPEGGGPSGVGKTNADGEYQLLTAGELGAVPGQHIVSIICVPEPAPVQEVRSDDPSYQYGRPTSSANAAPQGIPEIPARYNSQTQLREEVESGSNEINFDLES